MWKTIKDHVLYEINEKGEIRRKGRNNTLKPTNVNGHRKVILDGQTEYISRLVAKTYLRKRKERKEVHHINSIISDDRVENLKWANHKEIQEHIYDRDVNKRGGAVPSKKVKVIETGKVYLSIRSCAKDLKISPNQIRQCLKNPEKSMHGLHFVLLDLG